MSKKNVEKGKDGIKTYTAGSGQERIRFTLDVAVGMLAANPIYGQAFDILFNENFDKPAKLFDFVLHSIVTARNIEDYGRKVLQEVREFKEKEGLQ